MYPFPPASRCAQLKARTEVLSQQLEESEQTQSTLAHMLKRSQDEKLAHLATLKAFEDSIRVHRNEQELAEGVLRQVQKSRDEETAELHKMQLEVRKHLALLDRKLEGRRLEVRARQEKAKWRLVKLQEEMQLKAQAEGDLTEEEERAMIEKAKNLSQEASDLRAEKIRVQAEADAAESEFHRVRFAAGVPGPGPEAGATEEGAPFAPPEPEPIIHRFAKLEDEVNQIEEQLADYSQRQTVLQQQLAALRAQNQPRAKDRQDEEDLDVALTVRLGERTEVGKRALEAATRELDVARGLKLQLDQSVSVLRDRVQLLALPPPPAADAAGADAALPEIAECEGISAALLAADYAGLPSPWCRGLHTKALDAVQTLQLLMRAIDVAAAAAALRSATAYLQQGSSASAGAPAAALAGADSGSGGGGAADFAASAASLAGTAGSRLSLGGGGGSGGAEGGEDAAAAAVALSDENESDRRLEATIESLIVKNEWSIRVRPGSGATRKTISGKVLNEAVQAFEKTWKDVGSGAFSAAAALGAREAPSFSAAAGAGASAGDGAGGGGGAGGDDPFSREASQQRRRNSRIEMNAMLAAAGTPGVGAADEDPAGRSGAVAGGGGGDGGGEKATKGKKAKEPVDVNKPKSRDVQKFLATAAAMAGDEVEDALVQPKRDAEEVPTRDKLKRPIVPQVAAAKKK